MRFPFRISNRTESKYATPELPVVVTSGGFKGRATTIKRVFRSGFCFLEGVSIRNSRGKEVMVMVHHSNLSLQ